jgi:hypothetical protein
MVITMQQQCRLAAVSCTTANFELLAPSTTAVAWTAFPVLAVPAHHSIKDHWQHGCGQRRGPLSEDTQRITQGKLLLQPKMVACHHASSLCLTV